MEIFIIKNADPPVKNGSAESFTSGAELRFFRRVVILMLFVFGIRLHLFLLLDLNRSCPVIDTSHIFM